MPPKKRATIAWIDLGDHDPTCEEAQFATYLDDKRVTTKGYSKSGKNYHRCALRRRFSCNYQVRWYKDEGYIVQECGRHVHGSEVAGA